MPEANVRISQCMIVKNEEKNIERALSWGKSVMWEQIVVDTGSTDRTVEIARKMGAKVCKFPWIDDFAAAKNYAIEQCGGDWIAFLDADEYMLPKDVKKLSDIIKTLYERNLDGLSTGWLQLDDSGETFAFGTQVRFFRNIPDIRYRRRIHEQLESVSGRELRLGDGVKELSIFHTGYQSGNMEGKKKNGRNRRLILEELRENPDDFEMMGYMGDECLSDGDKDEAEIWYSRAIQHMPSELRENDQRSASTFTHLLLLFSEKEDVAWEQASYVYEQAVRLLPREADFEYMAGYFLAVKGDNRRAIDYLEEALRKLDAYGSNNKALFLAANLLTAYELLTKCCYEAGELEKCATYGISCLKSNPYNMAVLSRILMVLLGQGQLQPDREYPAVIQFLSQLYDLSTLKDRVFLVKVAEVSKQSTFAEYLMEHLFTKAEQSALEKNRIR